MKTFLFLAMCVLLAGPARCQDKTDPGTLKQAGKLSDVVPPKTMNTGLPVLTAEDKFAIRTEQLETVQAYAQLQNTQEFKVYQASAQKQQQFMAGLYSKYKIDSAKFQICDGPSAGTCEDVKKGEMEIRAVKAPKEEKK